MTQPLSADRLKACLADSLLAFPLTDFGADGAFLPAPFEDRVAELSAHDCGGLFVAAGAGEFFSLTTDEYARVLASAMGARRAGVPLVGAAGLGTRDAMAHARMVEKAGADGLLLLPPYLTEVSQAGLAAHIEAVCRSTGLGVVVYSRANGRLKRDTVARLAERCPNLIAVKDGVGEMEELWAMRLSLGDRLTFINGMPTAEVYAPSFAAIGVPAYSSAILSFLPDFAVAFHKAVRRGDRRAIDLAMQRFVLPYIALRARQPGYAVSIVKAGATITGRTAGPVRPPLSDLTPEEFRELEALIAAVTQPEAVDALA